MMMIYIRNVLPLAKIMELVHLVNVHPFVAVNKVITENTQNIFSLWGTHFGFIRYTLNKVDKIILITYIIFSQVMLRKMLC